MQKDRAKREKSHEHEKRSLGYAHTALKDMDQSLLRLSALGRGETVIHLAKQHAMTVRHTDVGQMNPVKQSVRAHLTCLIKCSAPLK